MNIAPRIRRLLRAAVVAAAAAASSTVLAQAPALPYTPGLDPAAMDRSADPCADFYQYACGGWIKDNPIPPDQTAWDVYRKLAEDNLLLLRHILEQAAVSPRRDAVTRQIGDHYAACMDAATVDRLGTRPLRGELDAIDALRSKRALAPLLARLQRDADSPAFMFGAGTQQDPDDSSRQIAAFDQGGLGLPDRDDYFRSDAKSQEIRVRYRAHVAAVLRLLGRTPAQAAAGAADVMRLETALAAASQTRVERRDPHAVTHKMSLAGFQALLPELDWRAYLAVIAPPPLAQVNVVAPGFFRGLSAALRGEPLPAWRNYLRFHLADSRSPQLSQPFVDQNFDFYRRYLRGAKAQPPRWKRCVHDVDEQLGEALGQAYVRDVFKPETKAATLEMVQRIEAAMARRLQTRDWMSQATRDAALAKLHAVRNKIGYPDHWRDYGPLRIARDDHAGNVRRAHAFEFERQLKKIGRPVDRDEWGMTPPTVNAYYDAAMNDINFPAGILQPPLYDPRMDAAPNYGNTGGTIGHELTHGFDDEGRQFDALGNLKEWWTAQDAARFNERAQCVSDQYSNYVVIDGMKINGKLTLGEDVADLGGQILAYEAWKEAVAGQDLPERDGLTPEQRFFVGFAQWACADIRPEQQRQLLTTDPHSPPRFRINGVVVNMPEFGRAFACKPGAAMTKPAAGVCSIW